MGANLEALSIKTQFKVKGSISMVVIIGRDIGLMDICKVLEDRSFLRRKSMGFNKSRKLLIKATILNT